MIQLVSMESNVEEIKKRIDIVEFIGSYISLKKAGRNFKGNCPFHKEKTPSFVVSPDRQIWHCFGACHEGGDVIKFYMKIENISFQEALKELAEKAGIQLKAAVFQNSGIEKKEKLIRLNVLAADYFSYILEKSPYGEKARNYLKARAIDEKLMKTFQLGYAPNSWDSLRNFLKKKKFSDSEMLEAGLLVRSEKGGIYDRFRGRLMFPLFDVRNTLVGFSGRVIEKEDNQEAKYVNTPETSLYHKRETLFGIQLAKEEIKKTNNVYIVEGEFDMISPYRVGIGNVVAIKGSALTEEQLMFLKRYTSRITLMLDADIAGEDAAKRGIEEAEIQEFEIEVVVIDFAKDPDEAVQADEVRFKASLKKAMPFYDFLIMAAQKKYPGDDAFSKKKIGEELAGFLSRIRNPIVKSYYIKKLANLLGVSERSVEDLMRKRYKNKKQNLSEQVKKTTSSEKTRETLLQYYVLSVMFQKENPYPTADEIFNIVTIDDFLTPSHKDIIQSFLAYKGVHPERFDQDAFFKMLSSPLQSVYNELYLFASGQEGFSETNIPRLAFELRRFSLKRTINDYLQKDEVDSDEAKKRVTEAKIKLNEVEKKLLSLYN